MTTYKLLKTLYWTTFAGVVVMFWIGLRTETYAVEYTFGALAFWAAGFFINKQLKKEQEH